ncbi:metal-dependent hydrolase [Patescibacteria group bacterium]|nr:metal-dependent hydrolase [Patescibacteria group bacterium]
MTGKTHFVVGANTAWIAYLLLPQDLLFIILPLIGGFAALLPDLDNRHATIHQWTKGLLRLLLIDRVRHRSLFHSLIILPVVIFVSSFLFPIHLIAPVVFVFGYASHPFIDGFNPQGCEYLYPWGRNFRLIPKFLCVDTGGWVDHLLFFMASMGIIAYLLMYSGFIRIDLMQ